MRKLSVPPLLAALLLMAAALSTLRAEEDPGALFMQAYGEFRTAEKLETEGRGGDALAKYRFCVTLLEQIGQKFPDYSPVVIEFRLGKSREAIARVEGSMSPAGNLPPLPGVIATDSREELPAVAQPSVQRRIPSFRIPVPSQPGGGTAPTPRPSYTGDEPAIGRGAGQALMREVEILRGRLQESERRAIELERQVLQEKAEKQSAYRDLDLTKVQVVELKSRLAQAGQRLSDLEMSNEALTSEKAVDAQRMAELEHNLEEVRADLEVAEEYNSELFAKVEKAAEFIEASEAIRTQLLDERKKLADEIAAGGGANEKTLKTELDRLVAENDKFKEQVTGISVIEEQNKDLASRLAEAEKRAEALQGERDAGREIEAGLRAEVEQLSGSIAALQAEIKGGSERVADLERQFEETSAATTAATGAMASENALLKEIVARQLREQARRQQARKLIAEEMEKLQIRSETLIEQLDAIANAETTLTSAEQKLLREPEVAVSASGNGSAFEFIVAKPESDDDLPGDLAEKVAEAEDAARQSDHAKARLIYQDIARRAPESFAAALKLGIASHHMQNYEEAIEAFRRALAIKPGEPSALTNLGIAELRSGDVDAAKQALEKAVAADDESHLSHYFLGLALQQEGDLDGAMRQARRSIELKSDYEPALELEQDLQTVSPPRAASGARP